MIGFSPITKWQHLGVWLLGRFWAVHLREGRSFLLALRKERSFLSTSRQHEDASFAQCF